jgi:hypothetical protein
MAKVEHRSISERTVTLSNPQKKPPKWQSLVSEIEEMGPDSLLALSPDEGDTIRALKVQISRAATAAGRKDDIQYGENTNGEIEVWLREKPKQKRGPRKTKAAVGEE